MQLWLPLVKFQSRVVPVGQLLEKLHPQAPLHESGFLTFHMRIGAEDSSLFPLFFLFFDARAKRKGRSGENPLGNKEIWESREMS